ncbi:MAG: metallophosphoesterase [Planctomycetota bacterium]
MILELYCPTRAIDALVVTCVTDDRGPIRVTAHLDAAALPGRAMHPPVAIGRGRGYHFLFDGLAPRRILDIRAQDAAGRVHHLKAATLDPPPGPRLARIGVVADAHLTDDTPDTYRLYRHTAELLEHALTRLADAGCDAVVALGDLTDQGTDDQLARAKSLFQACRVPVHPIIGNHEYVPERFLKAFGLDRGYRAIDIGDARLALLHTHSPSSLAPRSRQVRWLAATLDREPDRPTAVFSHYQLADHAYLARETSRTVMNHRAIAEMLAARPGVLAAFAGHRNIPARTEVDGVTHAVCAQPCQAPCGFDIVDVYATGVVRQTLEIHRLDLLHRSRRALGTSKGPAHYRYGVERARNFVATREPAPRKRIPLAAAR